MISMGNFNEEQMKTCTHAGACGGCVYQGVDYVEQLRQKNSEVENLLRDKGIDVKEYLGIEGSPYIYRYRNKMEYTFGDMVKGGEMTLGMHRKKSFLSIVPIGGCQIVDEDFNRIAEAVLEFCRGKEYSFYKKKTHSGFLRNLIIRKGVRTEELLVNIVTSSQGSLQAGEFVESLLKLKLNNRIIGILNTINDGLADFVHCDSLNVLWGADHYSERVMGLDFKVSAFSFFQTNIAAAERLYSEAISMMDSFESKTAFDLYCGTGVISQALALKAKKVLGIELSNEAVASAKENAEINSLHNCEFIAGDVLDVMGSLRYRPDVIVLDPPRAGVHPAALDRIIEYGADEIVYISCNPKTLVENLYYLQYYGYSVEKIKAYDNFPFTRHCECVSYLRRRAGNE